MSEVQTTSPEIPEQTPVETPVESGERTPGAASNGAPAPAARPARFKVAVHRLDGGLEEGASDARSLSRDGYPIYNPPDADRPRWIPARDIKRCSNSTGLSIP